MSSSPYLEVVLRHRAGTLALDVAFTAAAPWTLLFGPSGSGKSTILRAIAGMLRPDEGRIALRGQVVVDTAGSLWVPPYRRTVRWAGQGAVLFPKMSVEENLAFALLGDARRQRTAGIVQEAVRQFHLAALAKKMPGELSGGERQRVAVARAAIGAREKLLLLDEPFTGLDVGIRDELIEDLRGWLGGTPVLSVTHSVSEAFLLKAEVVRIGGGRVLDQGAAEIVLREERRRVLSLLG
ncbi:ATP-binding cassette domain-containing protein [Granulicella sp. WH15]|uniref:ATP-binding cassette domain-containing protein n=1 Tax=Granulicella sp. WH15 TaxID=2602070 RepID=UPI0013670E51|nr:ATP-binding cassette domain-containing protein [Granulicella sp. WH15]QHN04011.1 ATP-binding cassette domain-containing protein [Granulicella sp. WH15]